MPEETRQHVNESFRHKIEMCFEKGGGHFEQHI